MRIVVFYLFSCCIFFFRNISAYNQYKINRRSDEHFHVFPRVRVRSTNMNLDKLVLHNLSTISPYSLVLIFPVIDEENVQAVRSTTIIDKPHSNKEILKSNIPQLTTIEQSSTTQQQTVTTQQSTTEQRVTTPTKRAEPSSTTEESTTGQSKATQQSYPVQADTFELDSDILLKIFKLINSANKKVSNKSKRHLNQPSNLNFNKILDTQIQFTTEVVPNLINSDGLMYNFDNIEEATKNHKIISAIKTTNFTNNAKLNKSVPRMVDKVYTDISKNKINRIVGKKNFTKINAKNMHKLSKTNSSINEKNYYERKSRTYRHLLNLHKKKRGRIRVKLNKRLFKKEAIPFPQINPIKRTARRIVNVREEPCTMMFNIFSKFSPFNSLTETVKSELPESKTSIEESSPASRPRHYLLFRELEQSSTVKPEILSTTGVDTSTENKFVNEEFESSSKFSRIKSTKKYSSSVKYGEHSTINEEETRDHQTSTVKPELLSRTGETETTGEQTSTMKSQTRSTFGEAKTTKKQYSTVKYETRSTLGEAEPVEEKSSTVKSELRSTVDEKKHTGEQTSTVKSKLRSTFGEVKSTKKHPSTMTYETRTILREAEPTKEQTSTVKSKFRSTFDEAKPTKNHRSTMAYETHTILQEAEPTKEQTSTVKSKFRSTIDEERLMKVHSSTMKSEIRSTSEGQTSTVKSEIHSTLGEAASTKKQPSTVKSELSSKFGEEKSTKKGTSTVKYDEHITINEEETKEEHSSTVKFGLLSTTGETESAGEQTSTGNSEIHHSSSTEEIVSEGRPSSEIISTINEERTSTVKSEISSTFGDGKPTKKPSSTMTYEIRTIFRDTEPTKDHTSTVKSEVFSTFGEAKSTKKYPSTMAYETPSKLREAEPTKEKTSTLKSEIGSTVSGLKIWDEIFPSSWMYEVNSISDAKHMEEQTSTGKAGIISVFGEGLIPSKLKSEIHSTLGEAKSMEEQTTTAKYEILSTTGEVIPLDKQISTMKIIIMNYAVVNDSKQTLDDSLFGEVKVTKIPEALISIGETSTEDLSTTVKSESSEILKNGNSMGEQSLSTKSVVPIKLDKEYPQKTQAFTAKTGIILPLGKDKTFFPIGQFSTIKPDFWFGLFRDQTSKKSPRLLSVIEKLMNDEYSTAKYPPLGESKLMGKLIPTGKPEIRFRLFHVSEQISTGKPEIRVKLFHN